MSRNQFSQTNESHIQLLQINLANVYFKYVTNIIGIGILSFQLDL